LQEANITRRAPEAACWLRLGCWSNNSANGHPSLVHSTAEYCALVWCRSTHTCLIDSAINNTLGIVTVCLRPPADNLPTLAGIQPAELLRNGDTLSLARCTMEPGHLLHSALTHPSSASAWCLKLRHLFVHAAHLISLSDNNNIRAAQWVDHQWNAEWADNSTRLRTFIPDTGTNPPTPNDPPKKRAWVRLNSLRTGVGRFRS